jgi:hypothetical protein
MQVSKRKALHGDVIPPDTPGGRPNAYSDRSRQEQQAADALIMEPYKGYFIEGSALLVHPFSPDYYVGGSVLAPGRSESIVGITRFQIQPVHHRHERTGGMVRIGGCADRGGRMPTRARELNG